MRRIFIENARRRNARRRGAEGKRLNLELDHLPAPEEPDSLVELDIACRASPTHMTVETIFAEALALPAAERVAHLDAVCGKDAALRHRLEERSPLAMRRAIGWTVR